MTRDEAYIILGLKSGSTKNQVKSAFRKKAKFVHPDVNDSKDAHESFIKITEAYDTLINQKYQPPSNPSQPTKTESKPTDPFVKYAKVYKAPKDPNEYREWLIVAKARAKKVAKKEYEFMLEDIKLMKKVGKILSYISIISITISLLCIYDVHLNMNKRTEIIQNIEFTGQNYNVITDKNKYKIGQGDLINVAFLDDSVSISRTKILGVYDRVSFHINGNPILYKYFDEYRYGIMAGMYIGLAISILGFLYRKKSTGGIVAIFLLGFIFQFGSFLTVFFGLTL